MILASYEVNFKIKGNPMKTNIYVSRGLTLLGGLLLSSSLSIAGTSNDFTEKVKPFPTKDAKKNCLSQDGVFLENNYVATCVTQDGTFGTHQEVLGMTFNPEGTGTITTPDFLQPGKAFEFFSVSINGQNYYNNNTGEQNIDTKVTPLDRLSHAEQSGGAMAYSVVEGKDGTLLQMTQKYTVDPNAKEIIVRVEMKNIGKKTIKKLHYARGIDPNQDTHTHNTHYTHNTRGGSFGGLAIDAENIVHATGTKSDLALALYSVDKNAHNTCISAAWTQDAEAIYNRNYAVCTTKDTYFDATINLGFKLGSLKPSQTKVFSFKYLFDVTKPTKPVDKDAFIIEVKTDNTGVSANNAFTIPTRAGEYTYNYNVDCDSDGTNEAEGIEGDYTCKYDRPGTYTISIKDNTGEGLGFPAIYFARHRETKDNAKLMKIKQWGTGKWQSMYGSFAWCTNMDSNATDTPDLTFVTNMIGMFCCSQNYKGGTTSHWDVSNVIYMDEVFAGVILFNKPIGNWDVSNVTSMNRMFIQAKNFNQPLNNWNISNITTMHRMFDGATNFNQSLNNWDVSNVTDMSRMFEGATNFNQPLNNWHVSNVTTMSGMFSYASRFTNHDLSGWNVSNVTNHSRFSDGWGRGNIEPIWN